MTAPVHHCFLIIEDSNPKSFFYKATGPKRPGKGKVSPITVHEGPEGE
jgi:hypothetical protein